MPYPTLPYLTIPCLTCPGVTLGYDRCQYWRRTRFDSIPEELAEEDGDGDDDDDVLEQEVRYRHPTQAPTHLLPHLNPSQTNSPQDITGHFFSVWFCTCRMAVPVVLYCSNVIIFCVKR